MDDLLLVVAEPLSLLITFFLLGIFFWLACVGLQIPHKHRHYAYGVYLVVIIGYMIYLLAFNGKLL